MKQEDIMEFIKSQRLTWAAHVMRMENTRPTRKITEWTPYKTRPSGRPRLRWMDRVEEDLKRMKITGWRAKVEDRQEWNRIVDCKPLSCSSKFSWGRQRTSSKFVLIWTRALNVVRQSCSSATCQRNGQPGELTISAVQSTN